MTAPVVAYVTIGSREPARLISFYQALLGNDVTFEAGAYTVLGGGETRPVCLAFQQVVDLTTPVHVDLHVHDLEETCARVVELGGRIGDHHEEVGSVWRQAFDPDGNVFCLLAAAG